MNHTPYEHSVLLDESKCTGCTTCLKHCPTEAIRIKDGHAKINNERCIDCGECIRVCPHKAKKAVCGKLSNMDRFKWKIALPAPTLYGQFDNLDDIDYVLNGLISIGFDEMKVPLSQDPTEKGPTLYKKDGNLCLTERLIATNEEGLKYVCRFVKRRTGFTDN